MASSGDGRQGRRAEVTEGGASANRCVGQRFQHSLSGTEARTPSGLHQSQPGSTAQRQTRCHKEGHVISHTPAHVPPRDCGWGPGFNVGTWSPQIPPRVASRDLGPSPSPPPVVLWFGLALPSLSGPGYTNSPSWIGTRPPLPDGKSCRCWIASGD